MFSLLADTMIRPHIEFVNTQFRIIIRKRKSLSSVIHCCLAFTLAFGLCYQTSESRNYQHSNAITSESGLICMCSHIVHTNTAYDNTTVTTTTTTVCTLAAQLAQTDVFSLSIRVAQKSDEQKLIYSGKLLRDSAVLKDVLRQYDDGQDTHTVHLVFTPKNQRLDGAASSTSSTSSAANVAAAAASANGLR